jgi:hypothetical protein
MPKTKIYIKKFGIRICRLKEIDGHFQTVMKNYYFNPKYAFKQWFENKAEKWALKKFKSLLIQGQISMPSTAFQVDDIGIIRIGNRIGWWWIDRDNFKQYGDFIEIEEKTDTRDVLETILDQANETRDKIQNEKTD